MPGGTFGAEEIRRKVKGRWALRSRNEGKVERGMDTQVQIWKETSADYAPGS